MSTAEKAAELEMTVSEFLAFDDGTDARYELVDGMLTAMAPPSMLHSTIAGNLAGLLYSALRPPCRVRIEHGIPLNERNYFQADLTIACSDVTRDGPRPDPITVIEVVSPSSLDHDTGRKTTHYREIGACRCILLVEAERPRATLWTRKEDSWLVQDYIGLQSTLVLSPHDITLTLEEVYAGVSFEAEGDQSVSR